MTKKQFSLFLEECACELQAFDSTSAFIYDICEGIISATRKFQIAELKRNQVRLIREKKDLTNEETRS